jgi:hypothetical protein
MKKLLFFFAMLASVAASATVTVTPISTDYVAKKVTFKVAWTSTPSAPYNNRVWIWIDFCPVTGTQPAATFSPATITSPTKTGGNGTITGLNGRGFFIVHAATNAGTTVTATLSNASGKFNWCAYGSDYPPNAASYTSNTYTLKGTQPFIINGTTVNNNKFSGASITSLTDATGYPGCIGRDGAVSTLSCCTGLTAVGGYCRDLVADDASVADDLEVKKNDIKGNFSCTNHNCPLGWRPPTTNDAAKIAIAEGVYQYVWACEKTTWGLARYGDWNCAVAGSGHMMAQYYPVPWVSGCEGPQAGVFKWHTQFVATFSVLDDNLSAGMRCIR